MADVAGSVVTLRRAAGGAPTELTRDEREQLIAAAREGKLVSVLMEAVTFIQRDTPNRNYSRFTPQALTRMAPSFAGMPVLRDHEQGDALARAGRITESKLEESSDGAKQIRMTMELTAPWAVELALRGLVDRFSIGWHPTGPTECSVCGSEMYWYWCMGKDDHFLGDSYDGQVCELVYTAADGVEVSAVSVPAVTGTGVDDIRAQLAAARAASPAGLGRTENRMKIAPLILAALGLHADVEESAAVGAIERLKTDRDGAAAAAKDAQDQLATAKAELAVVTSAGKAQRIDALLSAGVNEGKYLPNGKIEAHLKKLAAKSDEEGIAAYLGDIEPGAAAPLGVQRQSAAALPAAGKEQGDAAELAARAQLSPVELSIVKQSPGVTAVSFLATKLKMTGATATGSEG